MLSGDLTTMSLADVFQWADASSKTGTIILERADRPFHVRVHDRMITAVTAPDAQSVPLHEISPTSLPVQGFPLPRELLCHEALYDQFLDQNDRFRFQENVPPAGEVAIENLGIQEAVMEAMRHLDEWPDVEQLYPADSARLRKAATVPVGRPSALHNALLQCAERGATLHEARFALGISRPATLRNVEALRRMGLVEVDGTEAEPARWTERTIVHARTLVRERQFDEATHVYSALLAADPGSQRIKQLLREAEAEQLRYLYSWVPESAVVIRTPRFASARGLGPQDLLIVDLINDRWDVATLVLASRLREVETLKCLHKLLRLDAITLRASDTP